MKIKKIDEKRHEMSRESHDLFIGIFDVREAEKTMNALADQYSELKEAAACATATRKKAEADLWKLCRKKEQTANVLGQLSEYGFELDQPVEFSEDIDLILRISDRDEISFVAVKKRNGADVGYLFSHACETVANIILTDMQDMDTDLVDFAADIILRRKPCQKVHDDIAYMLKYL